MNQPAAHAFLKTITPSQLREAEARAAEAEPDGRLVSIIRDGDMPFFTISIAAEDGTLTTEDLDPEEARKWFRDRNAKMDGVEKALDWAWNYCGFKPVEVMIVGYREPIIQRGRVDPNV